MSTPREFFPGRCLDCGDEWEDDEPPVICPECHSLNVEAAS